MDDTNAVSRACRDQPVTCRGKIAEHYGLTPSKRKPWQFEGRCPNCHHGGFSITAPNQVPNAPRHWWHCNCHRCKCPPEVVRAAMVRDGISTGCLGSYKQGSSVKPPADPAAALRTAMRELLADQDIRALADLKIRMLEVIDGKPAPGDFTEFVAFAARAGVQRTKRYEAAARWGRSQATAVGTPPGTPLSSDCRSDGKSTVPFRDTSRETPVSDCPETGHVVREAQKADCPVSGHETAGRTKGRKVA